MPVANKAKQRRVARVKAALVEAKITQQQVASESGTSTPHVCNVLSGRVVSAHVLATAERLLAEAGAVAKERLRPESNGHAQAAAASAGVQPRRARGRTRRGAAG